MAFRNYQIHRQSDQTLLAQAQNLYVFIDLNSGKPIRMPTELLHDFSANISPTSE